MADVRARRRGDALQPADADHRVQRGAARPRLGRRSRCVSRPDPGHAARRRRHHLRDRAVECRGGGGRAHRQGEVALGSADSASDVQDRRAWAAHAPRPEPVLRAGESRRGLSRRQGVRRHARQPPCRTRREERPHRSGATQVASKADDYSITSAPRVIKGRVITGSSGSEFGVRGFVAAYDAQTGKQVWRFWTVPGDPSLGFENAAMERAAKTWNGAWWKYGGGGTPWDGMAYDPELDLFYIGTGNGSPWSRDLRSPGGGDNLYLCSIVAIRPDTGEYVWHYQTTPADNWDYASTQPIVLADLRTGWPGAQGADAGAQERLLLRHRSRDGRVHLGAAVHEGDLGHRASTRTPDVRSRRPRPTTARQASVCHRAPMARTAGMPWRGIPGRALPTSPGRTRRARIAWDPDFQHQMGRMNTGRPRNRPAPVDAATHPGGDAGSRACASTGHARAPRASSRRRSSAPAAASSRRAFLVAWDPIAQKEKWRLTFDRPGITGGTLATAGNLLFHGSNDGSFSAYTADTGRKLWSVMLAPGFANPITYTIDGVQYVTVATGRSGTQAPGRLYTFAVDGQGRHAVDGPRRRRQRIRRASTPPKPFAPSSIVSACPTSPLARSCSNCAAAVTSRPSSRASVSPRTAGVRRSRTWWGEECRARRSSARRSSPTSRVIAAQRPGRSGFWRRSSSASARVLDARDARAHHGGGSRHGVQRVAGEGLTVRVDDGLFVDPLKRSQRPPGPVAVDLQVDRPLRSCVDLKVDAYNPRGQAVSRDAASPPVA